MSDCERSSIDDRSSFVDRRCVQNWHNDWSIAPTSLLDYSLHRWPNDIDSSKPNEQIERRDIHKERLLRRIRRLEPERHSEDNHRQRWSTSDRLLTSEIQGGNNEQDPKMNWMNERRIEKRWTNHWNKLTFEKISIHFFTINLIVSRSSTKKISKHPSIISVFFFLVFVHYPMLK